MTVRFGSEPLGADVRLALAALLADRPRMPTLVAKPKKRVLRKPARRVVRAKKRFKWELTAEDIALDNAISAAAARSLASKSA